MGYHRGVPKKPVEYGNPITVRLDEATHATLARLAKEDHRPPATVARLLIAMVCSSMGNRPLHEILASFPTTGGKGKK